MKKRKLRIVALMLLVALIMPCYANAGDGEATKDKMLTDEEMVEMMDRQAPAMAAYRQIVNAWAMRNSEHVFPEEFGGFYHTDDFKLAIKVVGDDKRFIEETKTLVDDPDILVFEETDISLVALKALSDELWNENPELLSMSGINQEKSVLEVAVQKSSVTKERANALLKLANMEHVEIVADTDTPQMQAAYRPGNMIYTNSSSKLDSDLGCEGTLGWYGTAVFKDGSQRTSFITAGHVEIGFNWHGADMYFGGQKVFSKANYLIGVGEGKYCRVVCGDSVVQDKPQGTSCGDYAIMASISSPGVTAVTPTNELQGITKTVKITDYLGKKVIDKIQDGTYDVESMAGLESILNEYGLLPYGTLVAKGRGRNGSTTALGETLNTWTQYTNGTYTITGLCSITPVGGSKPFSVAGDSGAPVYCTIDDTGKNVLLGIIHGGNSSMSYMTPITTIVHKGFIPYVG